MERAENAGAREPRQSGSPLRVRLLGPVEVSHDGRVLDLGSPKQRALFVVLVLHRGEAVSTDRIIDLLWGERPPRTASHSVQIYVSDLRRAFAAAGAGTVIRTRRPGYLIEYDDLDVDIDRFKDLAARGCAALAAEDPSAVELLVSAVALWDGDPLSDYAFEDFAVRHISAVQELRLEALEGLAAAWLAFGNPSQALAAAESAAHLDPLRERSRDLMMRALYQCGRAPEALRTFARFRELLADELGLDPSPALHRLQERILLHDPDLLPDVPPVTAIGNLARNPFKGLRPFSEADAEDFFGRERLVERVLEGLATGHRLVAVVGPSGSGKSSVVAAGVLPRLRAGTIAGSSQWPIVEYPTGGDLTTDLEAVIARALSGRATGPSLLPDSSTALLVMDQFEENFLSSDDDAQRQFLERLSEAVTDPDLRLTVLLTLRADLYDVPLRHRAFAQAFALGVVNVLPMSPEEIEAAVTSPAGRVGAAVEPALLAELVGDTAERPGLLPLLQYALTELFERRQGRELRLSDYREIGGLRGALTRRAEQLRLGWNDEEQAVATQLFLRLARLGDRDRIGRHRLPVGDLTALESVDPVAVSDVLEDLSRHRLISLDRELPAGPATIEVAHESLFVEWPWLSELVERHRTALRRHASLRVALDEWENADRSPGYLLGRGRLEEVRRWRREGIIQLTHRETAFLDACEAQAVAEEEAHRSRDAAERRLRAKARRRTLLSLISAAALASVVAAALLLGDSPPPRVAYVHHGTNFIERMIEDGLERAAAETPVTLVQSDTNLPKAEAEIMRLAGQGQDLVVVVTNETDLAPVARLFPDTHFVLFQDSVAGDNITNIEFADQESAFLAGAAAALATETGLVGFLGGADTPSLLRFEAGFVAGARAVDPGLRIEIDYATRLPNYMGFGMPELTERAARPMLRTGVDVVFVPAGGAQFGAFQAVIDTSAELDRHIWAIGADEDAFVESAWQRTPGSKNHILTSTIKRFDVAAYDAMHDYADGRLEAGSRVYDLANSGVGLATSGGFLDQFAGRLDELHGRIVDGQLVVPCVPERVSGEDAAAAAAGPKCPPA